MGENIREKVGGTDPLQRTKMRIKIALKCHPRLGPNEGMAIKDNCQQWQKQHVLRYLGKTWQCP